MTWLQEEERLIKIEMKRRPDRAFNNKYLLAIILFGLLTLLPHISHSHSCPHKEMLFPDVWICKQCGYDNYEGINTCAVCGTARNSKKR